MFRKRQILSNTVLLMVFTMALAVVAQAQAQLGDAETLSGTITMVDSSQGRLFVRANEASYSFIVESSTRITFDGRQLKLADLSDHVNKSVKVTFVPMRRGNVAQSIEVSQ